MASFQEFSLTDACQGPREERASRWPQSDPPTAHIYTGSIDTVYGHTLEKTTVQLFLM